jgi:hypothetical protein
LYVLKKSLLRTKRVVLEQLGDESHKINNF